MTYDDMIITLRGFGGDATEQAIATLRAQRKLLDDSACKMAFAAGLLKAYAEHVGKPITEGQATNMTNVEGMLTIGFSKIGDHLDGKEPD